MIMMYLEAVFIFKEENDFLTTTITTLTRSRNG